MSSELKPLILIVDDMPANVQMLAYCIKDQYRIKVANSGAKCLEMVKSTPLPDLILLDVDMPDLDGYEVCRQLKTNAKTNDIPVVFVTAKDTEQEEEFGLEVGAVDYITKPISPAIVRARVSTHVALKQQRDQLQKMALFDQLTDLYNRWYLFEIAAHKVSRAKRHGHKLSVLMLDIDHFKKINDIHGHPIGDQVLQEVAAALKLISREEDIVARFGGEEFVVLLEYCDTDNAIVKAEEIRQKLASLKPADIDLTISCGLATLSDFESDFEQLLKNADDALYLAKEKGRNRVEVHSLQNEKSDD
ncbi:GGDEF domain-containing response regulator [Aliikangiella sp. IMCC44632]